MHQAIYTNNGGWKVTEATPDLPAEVAEQVGKFNDAFVRAYEEYSNAYTKKIHVFKCVNNYAYYLCADRDGRVDQAGRKSLLVHCYANSLQGDVDDFIAHDDYLIAFSLDNFSDHVMQGEVVYDRPMTMTAAMEKCGLNQRKLQRLLRCVYSVLMDPSEATLNIHVPDESYIKPVMLCVYHVMPYSVRRLVSYSTIPLKLGAVTITFVTPEVPTGYSRTKLLSHEAQGGMHLLLDTMEEIGFDEDFLRNVKRDTLFNDALCEDAESADLQEKLRRFQELEDDLKFSVSDNTARHIKNLQTLHQLQRFAECNDDSEITNKEISLLTGQVLRFRFESDFTNKHLVRLIECCEKRDINLGESAMSAMQKKYSNTHDTAVSEAIFHFNCVNTLKLPQKEQIESLRRTYIEDKELFYKTLECLRENDRSVDKLDTARTFDFLFANRIGPGLTIRTIGELKKYLESVKRAAFVPQPLVNGFVSEKIKNVFKVYVQDEPFDKEAFKRYFLEYCQFAKEIVPEENYQGVVKSARMSYWNNFDISKIKKEDFDFYSWMIQDSDGIHMAETVKQIIELVYHRKIQLGTFGYETKMILKTISDFSKQEALLEFLTRIAVEKYPPDSLIRQSLDRWIDFAMVYTECSGKIKNIYDFAFVYRITIMTDASAYVTTEKPKYELMEIMNQALAYGEMGKDGSVYAQEIADAIKHQTRHNPLQGFTNLFKRKGE